MTNPLLYLEDIGIEDELDPMERVVNKWKMKNFMELQRDNRIQRRRTSIAAGTEGFSGTIIRPVLNIAPVKKSNRLVSYRQAEREQ